ncbi:MAG: NAD kinase [Pseudomonadota bacterium]
MSASSASVAASSRIAFIASEADEAQTAVAALRARYPNVSPEDADIIVALGGDGLMLQCLHRFMNSDVPIYGMNRGSVGFLMNAYHEDGLLERLAAAERAVIHPLSMRATDTSGQRHEALAVNEVSLFRQSFQAAKLEIRVDGRVRLKELICDGVLVATPAGSTAYNLSAHGPIIPINSPLLALTPLSPFRPRRWRGALLPNRADIGITVLEPKRRPVSAVADHTQFDNITQVDIAEARSFSALMLFDRGHNLEERILAEQFGY